MRLALATTLSLALALPLLAQEPTGRLIAALSGDWNGDAQPDAVLLVQSAEGLADVQVHLGGFRGLDPVLTVPGAIYVGPMGGQAPSLAARDETSFVIAFEQTGFGRTPWMASLVIAYRGGGFVVAGYSYDFYDRLDLGHYGRCDVDLVSGSYALMHGPSDGNARDDAISDAPDRHETGQTDSRAFALSDLRDGYFPTVCQALLD
ncbi:MAG: hypothetical protein KDK01_07200 [Rhodobacteraceae bacterium]|nr:hypothetical protein [Paracoccaceae bacterium]